MGIGSKGPTPIGSPAPMPHNIGDFLAVEFQGDLMSWWDETQEFTEALRTRLDAFGNAQSGNWTWLDTPVVN